MEDNQVSINIEDTTNEKKSKKGLILVILGLLIIAVGGVVVLLFLSKDKAAKLNGKYFDKDTYYSCTPDTKNDGPMQYYMELDNKGRYVAVLASPTLYVSAGLYEINDSTLTINEQFTKTYQFPAQESNREYEMTYENGTLKDDSSKCKTISKSEFKESVKEFGYKSYDEMKKSYEDAQNDPDASNRKYEDVDDKNSDRETLEDFGLKNETIKSKDHSFTIEYVADYLDENTIATIDVTIKSETGKEIVKGNCYSLSNETISRFKINSDDTISLVRTGEGDDNPESTIETLDYEGNVIESKKVLNENLDTLFTRNNSKYYYDGQFN